MYAGTHPLTQEGVTPLIPPCHPPNLLTSEGHWTIGHLHQLQQKSLEDRVIIFLAWNTIPSGLPRLLRVAPPVEGWEPSMLAAAAGCDVIPLTWFVARHNEILAKLDRVPPWLDRVTFAIEGLGRLMGIWAETLEDVGGDVRRWARWYAKVCSIARNIGAGLLREAEEEGGGRFGERDCRFPDFGICNDWKLELPAYVAMARLPQSRWGAQGLATLDRPTKAGAKLLAVVIKGLLAEHAAAIPSEAQARGHEILFWCCVYRKVIWRLSSARPADVWGWAEWSTAASAGHEEPLAHGWRGADAGANGRMDKYVDARARFTPMCAQQAALLAQASAYLAQLLAAVDAVHVALDDCVDTLLGPASDTEPDLLAAPATAAAMHAAGHISKTELDGVVAGECVADDYVLALDTECRTAGKLCSFLHRVLLSSAAQLAGVGPLVPHAGILLDTATLAGEPVLGLRTQAAASFTALQRRHEAPTGLSVPPGATKDDANAMVLAAVALASHFKHFAYCRTCSEIIQDCTNRAISTNDNSDD